MPQYLTLPEAKKHLNVDHDEDDDFIVELIDVAEDFLSNLIHRPLYAVEESDGTLPPALRHALRMIVARLYADREGYRSGRMTELPFTIPALISPYRIER